MSAMLDVSQNRVRDFVDMLETYMDTKADPRAALQVRDNNETRAKLWESWGNAIGRAGSRLDNPYR